MRVFAGVFALALLLAVPLQVSGQEMTKEQVAKIEADGMALADGWIEGWEELNCEKSAGFIHPERGAFLYGGKPLNRSEWLETCSDVAPNQESYSGEMLDGKVYVLTPKAAVVVFTAEQTYNYTDGTTRHYPSSAFTGLVELMETGWVFTTFSFSAGSYDSGEGG